MAAKRSVARRDAKTGSYTVHVPKSAATGKFVSGSQATGRIKVGSATKKAS